MCVLCMATDLGSLSNFALNNFFGKNKKSKSNSLLYFTQIFYTVAFCGRKPNEAFDSKEKKELTLAFFLCGSFWYCSVEIRTKDAGGN